MRLPNKIKKPDREWRRQNRHPPDTPGILPSPPSAGQATTARAPVRPVQAPSCPPLGGGYNGFLLCYWSVASLLAVT